MNLYKVELSEVMLETDFLLMLKGSLNVVCEVRPSSSKVAAMPVNAHATTL